MESASASAPSAPHIEPEPAEWQPRATWVTGRLLCGAISFFFASFLFAFFYLKALDTNHSWTIGQVVPDGGIGVGVATLLVASAVIFRLSARRPTSDAMAGAIVALVLGLAAVILQFVEYIVLDFGASQGGYAAVFFGWTATYAIVALLGLYWIEIQVATLIRVRRRGAMRETEVPTSETALLLVGIEASSFYWAYFAAIGVLAYILLYLVG
jgi:heme/copper-type cytochrome/quinol oxidase subunit 3